MGLSQHHVNQVDLRNLIFDKVLATITDRFAAIYAIDAAFKFLWLYPGMTIEALKDECTAFSNVYTEDVDGDEHSEICLKQTHSANIIPEGTSTFILLNKITKTKLSSNYIP